MRGNAQCMKALKNMRALWCSPAPPAQIVKYSFNITLSITRRWSRSKYGSVIVRVFRSEDLERFLPLPSFLKKSLNYVHLANRSNLGTASWNSVVVWKYCFLADEHGPDPANRNGWWCFLSGPSAIKSQFFHLLFGYTLWLKICSIPFVFPISLNKCFGEQRNPCQCKCEVREFAENLHAVTCFSTARAKLAVRPAI